jgi:integrase
MTNSAFQKKLNQANGRLKAAKLGVRIEQRGSKLSLVATFPPKPKADHQEWKQQRLALGIYANGAGLQQTEKEARKVGALLATREFRWQDYLQSELPAVKVKDQIGKLEKEYFSQRERSPQTESTWEGDYMKIFRKLPPDQPLSEKLIMDCLLTTKPDTRTRKRAVIALQKLADIAGMDIDLTQYKGSYSPKRASPRDIPEDKLIAETFKSIPNPQWQWVYGMIAAFGLRPHEVFWIDSSFNSTLLSLLGGKTGPRRVWAIYPEWVERFSLLEINPPNVSGTNQELGHRVATQFKRYQIPFKPYDLRHAWAIRSMEFGLDISLAAQQMGHCLDVHSDIYHHWISDAHHQRAYDLLCNRSDRPLPPDID